MAAPAVGVAARAAVAVARDPKLRRYVAIAAVALCAIPLLFVTAAASFFSNYECAGAQADDFGGTFDGPGSLGGVLGTGVTRAEMSLARSHPFGGPSIVPGGSYVATAYAPSAGGINCGSDCNATASGIRVNGGKRKLYIVASNPAMNKYGAIAYIWPNPYGWRGPFIVADTGGNFDGRDGKFRIDFYTWGSGDARANSWGRKTVRVSEKPIVAGGPTGRAGDGNGVPVSDLQCETAGDGGFVDFGDGGGKVVIAPGANRAGVSLQPALMSYVSSMTRYLDSKPLVITTGTNHNKFSSSGNVSDHWAGFGADFGMSANGFSYGCRTCRGTVIAAAALRVAGVTETRAISMARGGGAHTVNTRDGWRVQVIWLSSVGGDHFNHVHLGIGRH